jgi:hypothetical protein
MRLSTASVLAVAVAPIAVSAAPFRRATDNGTATVLQFAHVLEQLETCFYSEALAKFQPSDFIAAGFSDADIPVQEFTAIQNDESTHVTVLESLLTSFAITPLSGCKFDFSSALTDVKAMLPVARIVENVGVGAYLGAAHLVADVRVLTDAASILTVEARHQTILNVLSGGSSIPQSFDIPLAPQEVLAIAGGFISGCDLGITPNAALTISNTGSVGPGTLLQFSSPALNGSTDGFFCQMLLGGAAFSISLPIGQCTVPAGINGPVAVFVTSDDQPLNGNVVDRQSNALIAGPAMAFIDTVPEALSQLVLGNSNNSSGNGAAPPPPSTSTSTSTLQPAQASSLLSSLGSSPTGLPPSNGTNSPSNGTNNPSNGSASPSNGSAVIVNGISMIPMPTSTPGATPTSTPTPAPSA